MNLWLGAPLLALMASACSKGDDSTPVTSAPASSYDFQVAKDWMDLSYTLVKTTAGYSPPVASRAFAYLGVGMYEAMVNGAADHNTLAGQLNGLAVGAIPAPLAGVHHWPSAVNAAMAVLMTSFFPASTAQIGALETSFADAYDADPTLADDVLARSIQYGQDVAAAILTWRDADGFSGLAGCNAAYVPPAVAGAWTPVPPAVGLGLQPCWGTLRTFAVTNSTECAALGHPAYSTATTSSFYAHALLIYNTTGDAGATLTADQLAIANYWSDAAVTTGTPPGHWVAIAGIVAEQEALTLDIAAEAYARVGIAVADAFITCWRTKFDTYLLRPITYIQANIDPAWDPLLGTPNFPTYTSGHSSQSGAAAAVLTGLFGPVAFTDTTHTDLNPALGFVDRSFDDFMQAATEAKLSRMYGGIHYTFDNDDGFDQGLCIGSIINDEIHFVD